MLASGVRTPGALLLPIHLTLLLMTFSLIPVLGVVPTGLLSLNASAAVLRFSSSLPGLDSVSSILLPHSTQACQSIGLSIFRPVYSLSFHRNSVSRAIL